MAVTLAQINNNYAAGPQQTIATTLASVQAGSAIGVFCVAWGATGSSVSDGTNTYSFVDGVFSQAYLPVVFVAKNVAAGQSHDHSRPWQRL
jgi:hypothetical protein